MCALFNVPSHFGQRDICFWVLKCLVMYISKLVHRPNQYRSLSHVKMAIDVTAIQHSTLYRCNLLSTTCRGTIIVPHHGYG